MESHPSPSCTATAIGSSQGLLEPLSRGPVSLGRPPAAFDRSSLLFLVPPQTVLSSLLNWETSKMMKWNFTQGYQSTIDLDLHLSEWQTVSFALAAVLMILLVFAIFILCICIKERVRERRLHAAELQIMRARQPTVAQVVASFTMMKYQPGGPSAEDHCPICMGEYCDGEGLVCLPCGHVLHGACLVDWFMHGPRPTCPCCRNEYALDVVKG